MSKPKVLFIDDEERIVRSLAMQFRSLYAVKTSIDPNEALELLGKDHFHVIVSDQRMPKMQGIELLRQARKISPNSLGILLTGYADWAAITGAINDGEIFRYLNKPWDQDELRRVLDKATDIAVYMEKSAQANTINETSTANVNQHQLIVIDDSKEIYEIIAQQLKNNYTIYWTPNLEQAFDLLTNNEIAVVITDLKLKGEDITSVLKTLKQYNPHVLTIVLTAMSDSDLLISLINQAQVFRYLPKPVRPNLLEKSVYSAIELYKKLRFNPELTKRHSVEDIPAPVERAIPTGISSFLNRFKSRFTTLK